MVWFGGGGGDKNGSEDANDIIVLLWVHGNYTVLGVTRDNQNHTKGGNHNDSSDSPKAHTNSNKLKDAEGGEMEREGVIERKVSLLKYTLNSRQW